MISTPSAAAASLDARRAPATDTSLYRAVWRWHFYAGLLVLPFLILLAVTGGLYLFHKPIDGWFHRDLLTVAARDTAPLPPQELVERALAQHPGASAYNYLPPASPAASAEIGVETAAGEKLRVFLDPHDGRVLGALPKDGSVMLIVRRLHSLALLGQGPNYLIEIVGGWAVILVATGIYLWWPRRQRTGGVVSVRGAPRQRVFWRDLHAVTGLFAGLLIGFLALSGMPWSTFWGDKSLALINSVGGGFPNGAWGDVPTSAVPMAAAVDEVGWTLQQAPMPTSPSVAGHDHGQATGAGAVAASPGLRQVGLDAAVQKFTAMGVAPGYAVDLPTTPDGVYTGSVYPPDLALERVIHLDQYTGEPIIDVGFNDYGAGGKAIEWGINVHMGQEFGLANQLVMAATAVAIVLMSVSAAVMWWKRRPAGRLGVPPPPADRRTMRGVLAIMAVAGVLFPLTGLSMLAALAIDWLVRQATRWRSVAHPA